ncbi:PAS domain-containing protein [Lysobacter sp. MMG2]|uniref:PAS domain-containing protein n=1 Tax=Lysobacter sp. MMG2 TaxID=2801338 RepID=UPI001C226E04|nr:PAS domain-containing protein [Lysobacter sp. MMG2]
MNRSVVEPESEPPASTAACDPAFAPEIFARIVEQSSVGMVVAAAGSDNPVLYVNDAFLRMSGHAREEVLGRNCRFLQGPDTDPAAVADIAAAIREDREFVTEILNYRKDGSTFWNLLHISPVREADGSASCLFGYQRDVTRRKEMEDALQQCLRLEALGKLTGGIAHEFNNLLQVIGTTLDILEVDVMQSPELSSRSLRHFASCREAIDRVDVLTSQLQTFARGRPGSATPLSVNTLLENLRTVLSRSLGEQVQLTLLKEEDLWWCSIDPVLAETALLNVAINARDAMLGRDDQSLVITSRNRHVEVHEARMRDIAAGRYVAIELEDSGCGMPRAILGRVLDPFFSTKGEGKGVGLGLSMAYGFARQSGGTLFVESQEDKGTRITFLLPVCESAEPSGVEDARDAAPSQPRVLVVDDREDLAFLMQEALSMGGYHVATAHDAESALAMLQQDGPFDLLLSDIVMPGARDGVALARDAVRRFPHLSVLLMTGHAGGESGDGPIEFDVLAKPFRQPELLAKVQSALEASRGRSAQGGR